MMTDLKLRLIELLLEKSFKYSETPTFRLASGALSSYYIDCRPVTHSPEGKYIIGTIVCDMLRGRDVQAVGGLTMGADPIACAASFAAWLDKTPIASFSIRKEPKGHGLGRQVEGDVSAGDRVVILEDVVTTGGSTIKAIEAARREDLVVTGVVALVDREEGGREAILEHVPDVRSICTRAELLEALKTRK